MQNADGMGAPSPGGFDAAPPPPPAWANEQPSGDQQLNAGQPSGTAPAGFGAEQPSGFAADQPAGFAAEHPGGFGTEQATGFGADQPAGLGAEQTASFGADQPAGLGAEQPGGFGAQQPAGFGAEQTTGLGAEQPGGFGAQQSAGFEAEQAGGSRADQAGGFGAEQPGGFAAGQAAGVGAEQPAESIVPDSWFAQPRKPDSQPEAQGPQVWTPQPQSQDQAWGMDAAPLAIAGSPPAAEMTQLDGPSPDGATQFVANPMMDATQFDSGTRVDGMAVSGHGGMMGPSPAGDPMASGGFMGNGAQMGPGGPMGPGGMGPGGPGPMGTDGQGGQMNGYGGFPPAPTKRSGSQASKPLIISVCALVAVALVAVAFVMWPDGEKKSPPAAKPSATGSGKQQVAQKKRLTGPARQQANAVNELLNASADTRKVLARALASTRQCKELPTAIGGFQTVAQRRQNQLRRTQNLQLDKLQNGERLRAHLRQAFQASLEVDQALLNWARSNQQRCHGKPRPDAAHVPGRAAAEQRATQAKQRFVVLWNPVAKRTSQPQRRWTQV
ncbi:MULTISPECIES: hypothetical protein [Actinomadura]|uniref:DUF5667 domain-containing protein n=1 Tax=Actinomadura yumaensis TaxID=111807 RepID=A0ABW2CGB5_9ACTN|nr:hypothetical protein [Actinomadura sp. J1-007]MWK34474.1 hypothetical protein [Actinomadura sp. J1-007]